MDYTITNLSVEELDMLLVLIKKFQKTIEHREAVHLRNKSLLQESAAALLSIRQQNELDIYVNQGAIAAIPDGPLKHKNLIKQAGLEYKKLTLFDRTSTSGNVALLMKELDVACVQKQLGEITALLETLEARKALLLNPPAGSPPLQTGLILLTKKTVKNIKPPAK